MNNMGQLGAGWDFLLKVGLVLLPIALASQMWLSRAVWQMLERVNSLTREVTEIRRVATRLAERVARLEKDDYGKHRRHQVESD